VGGYLPTLLSCPDDTVLKVLGDLLYHDDSQVQNSALTAIWCNYEPDRTRQFVLDLMKKRGPTALLGYFISWRQPLFAGQGPELANICMAALKNTSPRTVAGGCAGLLFLRAQYDWTNRPQVRDQMDEAMLDLARKLGPNPDAPWLDAINQGRLVEYLSAVKTEESRLLLWRYTELHATREQALICLCWMAQKEDFARLTGLLMTEKMHNLPYHLYRAYGQEVLPLIAKAAKEAADESIRRECQEVLDHPPSRDR